MDEELAKFLASGPTADELEAREDRRLFRFHSRRRTDRRLRRKIRRARGQHGLRRRPDAYKDELEIIRNATPSQVKDAVQKWLSDGVYVLEIDPFPTDLKAASSGADRKKMPEGGAAPAVSFPSVEKATLSNGMKVMLAERHAIPVIDFSLILDAGYAADQGGIPGTANLALSMLDEGTKTRSSLQISDEEQRLGANVGAGSNLDSSFVTLSALKSNLDASLALYADIILNPSFPESDFKRLQKQQLAGIQREKSQPIGMALRVFPKLLYGASHPYGLPFSGSGYENGVVKITRDDLVKFHGAWFKPNNATMVIVGDTTMAEIKPKLESLFKSWQKGTVPAKKLSTVPAKSGSTIYIVDKPGAEQSVILAGQLVVPTANPDEISFKTMNQVLGGAFIARLNMNLREDKHWSYGSYTFVPGARGQRPFIGFAPVQTDKTKESLAEMMKEFKGIAGAKAVAGPELQAAQDGLTRTMPGEWETQAAVAQSIGEIVRFGLPDDYFTTFPAKVRAPQDQRRGRHGEEDSRAGQNGLGRGRRSRQDRTRYQVAGLG
jgi:zinc protease